MLGRIDLHIAFTCKMPQPQRFIALGIEHIDKILLVGRHGAALRVMRATDFRDPYFLEGLMPRGEKQAVHSECSGGQHEQKYSDDDSEAGLMLPGGLQNRTA